MRGPDCPNCGEPMEWSSIVIDTAPQTRELNCKCGLVLDVCDGHAVVCSGSKLTEDGNARVREKLLHSQET